MIATLKSEFRKLLTVRSTYFNLLACILLVMFVAGFVQGMHTDKTISLDATTLMHESYGAITVVGFVLAFVGLLLVGHEYRYSTIMYSLVATNRRLKVLAAKFVVVSIFAAIASVVLSLFAPLCFTVGLHLNHINLPPQHFDYWSVIWRTAVCGWGYSMYAFVLVVILRNQIGAIVTFLLVPLIGEGILGQLLKENAKYLPFTGLQTVVGTGGGLSLPSAVLVVLAYVAAGLLVGFVLFEKRDAN